MSVRRLAELAGVSNPYLSQIERGLRRPSAEILQQLAKALKISVETLYVRAGLLAGARTPRRRACARRSDATRCSRPSRSRPCSTCTRASSAADRRARSRAPGMPTRSVGFQGAVKRVAMISLHTSPLLQPGSGDSGGMNVYVRELASALAQAGVECTTYTRADRPACPRGGRRAGAPGRARRRPVRFDLPKEALPDELDEFAAGVLDHLAVTGRASTSSTPTTGCAAWPATGSSTSSTCRSCRRSTRSPGSRPRAATPSRRGASGPRPRSSAAADAICVSCPEEERQFRRLYGDPAGRIEIVPPGVEHAFFAPGDRARRPPRPRPARRPCRCCCSSAASSRSRARRRRPGPRRSSADRDAVLVIVGGASGADGDGEVGRGSTAGRRARPRRPGPLRARPSRTTSCRPTTAPPMSSSCPAAARASGSSPSRRRRAASRSSPAPSAGCSRSSTTASPGFLVEGRDPARYARAIAELLDDPPARRRWAPRRRCGRGGYTWSFAAARLRRLYADLATSRARARRLLADAP